MENNEQYEEISLLDLLAIFGRGRKFIALTTLIFMLLGALWVFVVKPPKLKYKSTIQMLVVSPYVIDNESMSLNVRTDMVVGVLRSRAVTDVLTDRFKLNVDKKSGKAVPRDKLYEKGGCFDEKSEEYKCTGSRDTGVVTLNVTAEEPETAQAMATAAYKKADEILKEIAVSAVDTANTANDEKLEKEIQAKIAEVSEAHTKAPQKISELLGMYSVLMARDESYRLKGKQPIALQLLSPASLPDEAAPRGRGKTLVLFTMLGFFLGIAGAFMKHVWSTVEPEKKAELKAAFGKK
ncbi:MAG: Wzz/FepE/Etk N-terminal domain-containing protein [Synergistaceae bacterium]|nr:Wzz/FepE/Etk N-terminal domain-containing protein [Synergistaceae bacterium]